MREWIHISKHNGGHSVEYLSDPDFFLTKMHTSVSRAGIYIYDHDLQVVSVSCSTQNWEVGGSAPISTVLSLIDYVDIIITTLESINNIKLKQNW